MSDEYVEEACYYLAALGVEYEEIGKQMNLNPEQVKIAVNLYKEKIERGQAMFEEDTKQFWAKSLRESSGDEKVTMVDEKGRYYHGWKSELETLPTDELVQLLVVNKKYSESHPLSGFSKTQAAIGYDPLVPLKNIRRTVSLIDEILQKRTPESADDKDESA